jgi:hypothetical protein
MKLRHEVMVRILVGVAVAVGTTIVLTLLRPKLQALSAPSSPTIQPPPAPGHTTT